MTKTIWVHGEWNQHSDDAAVPRATAGVLAAFLSVTAAVLVICDDTPKGTELAANWLTN